MLRIEEYNLLINSAGERSEAKKITCPIVIPEEIERDFCTIHLFVYSNQRFLFFFLIKAIKFAI